MDDRLIMWSWRENPSIHKRTRELKDRGRTPAPSISQRFDIQGRSTSMFLLLPLLSSSSFQSFRGYFFIPPSIQNAQLHWISALLSHYTSPGARCCSAWFRPKQKTPANAPPPRGLTRTPPYLSNSFRFQHRFVHVTIPLTTSDCFKYFTG